MSLPVASPSDGFRNKPDATTPLRLVATSLLLTNHPVSDSLTKPSVRHHMPRPTRDESTKTAGEYPSVVRNPYAKEYRYLLYSTST
eukprot:scaffold347_cov239-Pinguiococcus_pyrenoidosus.AAC.12